MQNPQGVFIVLEGSDGAGKGTQFELLKKRLLATGYEVEVFDFPRYDQPSSHFVKRYLNGDYGPASDISPYTASLFYALDRYEAAAEIKKALDSGKIVLSNRYTGSNMAHQGAKFNDVVEKRSFFVWADSLEFQLLNIPRPNINLFLRVPADISFELIRQKAARSYTDKSHDEHEADINHLKKSVETYDLLCELFPRDYKPINCAPDGKLLIIEAINQKIWEQLQPYLPHLSPKPKTAAEEELPQPQAKAPSSGSLEVKIPKISLLAATELLKLGFKLNVQSGRDWSGKSSRYSWLEPAGLKEGLIKSYQENYQMAANLHQKLVAKLPASQHYLAAAVIPSGAYFAAVIKLEPGDAQLIAKLEACKNPELKQLCKIIKSQTDKHWPSADQTPESSAKPEGIGDILEQISATRLPQNLADDSPLELLEANPRNEFELLADGLYPYSDLTHSEILAALQTWDYQQKAKALSESLGANQEMLASPTYKFDGLADRQAIMSLYGVVGAEDLKIQQASVRYGYEVPEAIDKTGEEDDYMTLFDSFLELYSDFQSISPELGEYATLSGHKIRWQGKLRAADIKSLMVSSDKSMADFGAALAEKVREAHPLVADALARPAPSKNRNRRRRDGKSKKS